MGVDHGARPLAIVVGPAGDDGEAICETLGAWAQAELLRDFYWVTPQEFPQGVVDARRLDASGVTPTTLPEDLGSIAWDRCRFMAVQLLAPSRPGDESVAAFAADYARFLERQVLPMGTPTMKINLLVPTSDLPEASVSRDLLILGWDQTVVASPEERASTEHPNVLVLDDHNLTGHAAMAIAAAAGLWIGMSETPFDGLVQESGSGDADPRVMRSFVRAVRGGEVTSAIAEVALTPKDGRWRVPHAEKPVAAAADATMLIEDAVRELGRIDEGALEYGPPPPMLTPQKTKVGWAVIWADFKEFWVLQLRRIGDIPARLKAAAEDRISKKLFGEDGAQEFGFGVEDVQDKAAQLVELRDESGEAGLILGQARVAERALALLGSTQRPEASRAQAWADLRQLCLGMVDAGSLPAEMPVPMVGSTRQVIVEPAKLVPNSEEPRFAVPGDIIVGDERLAVYRGLELPPCDPLLTARLDRDLDQVRNDFAVRADEEASAAIAQEQALESLRGQAAAAGEGAAGWAPAISSAESELTLARDRQAKLQIWVDRLTEVEQQLTDWAQPRLGTLMWRVGETVGRHLDNASIDQAQALADIGEPVELDITAIDRARRSLARSLIFWLLACVVGSVLAVVLAAIAWAPFVGLTLLLVLGFGSFARYSRIKSECEWKFAQATARQINALNRLAHAAREVSRLATLYRLYVEWSEILGYQAHAPWTPDEEATSRPPVPTIETGAHPPALLVGSSEVADENVSLLGGQAARDIQREGWLTESYQGNRDFSMERLARQEGRDVGDLDPDRDAQSDPTGARPYLLDDLRAHRPQRAAFREAFDGIAQFCSTLSPDSLFTEVTLDGGEQEAIAAFLEELVPSDDASVPGFLIGLLNAEARISQLYDQVHPYIWAPPGIGDPLKVVHQPVPTTRSGQYLLQAVRVDIGPKLDADQLAFLGPRSTPQAFSPSRSSDDF